MRFASAARSRGAALALAFALFLLALPARAGDTGPIVLDDARRSALAALPALTEALAGPEALEGRVVVLAFFASWCPPCHPEFDHLKAIDARYREYGVTVVAVNIFENHIGGGDTSRLQTFLAKKAPEFAVLGEGERVAQMFGAVERIPTLFVFRADGDPALQFIHARGAKKTHASFEEIEAAVQAAL